MMTVRKIMVSFIMLIVLTSLLAKGQFVSRTLSEISSAGQISVEQTRGETFSPPTNHDLTTNRQTILWHMLNNHRCVASK